MAPRAATGTGERVPLQSEEPPASEPVGPWRAQGPLGSGVLGEPHPEGVSGAFSCQMTWALGFSLPILGSGCFPFSPPPRAKPLVGTLFHCHPFAPVGQKMNVLCHPPYSWGDLGDLLSPSLSQVLVPPHKPLPPLSQFGFPPHFGVSLLQTPHQKGPARGVSHAWPWEDGGRNTKVSET